MDQYPKLNTSFQERSDYEDVVQSIETRHRHDLAVHLYLAFLLHNVNPLFPASTWTSWPPHPLAVLDPQMTTDAEDFVLSDLQYDGTEALFYSEAARKATGRKNTGWVQLQKRNEKVPVRFKRQKLSSPKVTLVNEVHFLLQRKIKDLVRRVKGTVSLEDDSPLMKSIATRLANRMGNVLDRLADQSLHRHQTTREIVHTCHGTWQDVALANFYNDKLGTQVDVDGHRKLYHKMQELFQNVLYPYEYDPSIYIDETTGVQEEVPEFDVTENLEAIEKEGLAPTGLGLAQDHMDQQAQSRAVKERVFWGLMDQAAREKQLAHDKPEGKSDPLGLYQPEGDFFAERRQRVFRHVSLKPKDFKTVVKHAK
ncbi:hypothetical protein METBIDRAFT_206972 [Metschnikowia bicuspidata var. bicuspidata NRRL YB-4993]|uniref:Rrn9 domain-containing protein n=1 Tax=Metschnikowia bicuspidata var. bicuspidata NRRL YB-4993 TaxID=869754 RepID=A0A1A0H767_9ASCO|nr:hypothetical protein METBIDRAFT_206972 [Metschnikowia bicuspidata var. bicuspidata NRRL YB-4993]OBA19742.1 hypothetical protein METBIDRAFT_206972 [Metschnikowia bicuspidata var. bicuspidata NRRL YB-4993]